jgi:hypothetical protein
MRRIAAVRGNFAIIVAVCVVALCGTDAAHGDDVSVNALFTWPPFAAHAHSHNDYQQMHPLRDAIRAHVHSVEADLYLDRGIVRVAHDRGKWRGDFESLYVAPINALWEKDALPVKGAEPFLLWLDLKETNARLRSSLHDILMRYPVTRAADPARAQVEIILTGNESAKKAFVHEYPSEISTRDSNIFSDADEVGTAAWRWYALDWSKLATWNGEGAMPPHERHRLRELVKKIHTKNRKLRLWKHPATLAFWKEAVDAGVDRLGTDLLPHLLPPETVPARTP